MLKHKIYLTIWLILFAVASYYFISSASTWHESKRAFQSMEKAVVCRMDVDFSKEGVYSSEFRHISNLSPHGVMLLADVREDSGSIAEILAEAEAYLSVYDGYDKIFTERMLEDHFINDLHADDQGKKYTSFLRFPFHSSPKTYTIKIEVAKACRTPAHFMIIAKYDFCGLEYMFVMYMLVITCVAGILALLFLSCALWRVHLIRSVPVKPSGSKTMYLLSVYPRWSETFIRNDIRHLMAEGVNMELISLFPGNCEMEEGWPEAVTLSPYAGWGSEQAMKDGKRSWLRRLPCPRWLRFHISLLKHRQLLNSIVTECRQSGIGHIHAEFADLAALLGAMAARKAGCTFSVGIHALDVHKMKYPAHAIFDGTKFITVCNQAAAIAFSNACPWAKQRLHIIHHGIELQNWPYSETREKGEVLKILYVGRLVPKKGVSILIDAMEMLVNHAHAQAELTIIGDGPLADELKAQAAALGIEKSVTFTGRLKQSDIKAHFKEASCLCAPSVVTEDGDMDGVPNVILEAMASGLPVVGSLAGSLSEVITAETAWPVSDLAAHTLADAIMDMASQPQETDRRRQNARSHVEYRFDADKLAKKRAMLFS